VELFCVLDGINNSGRLLLMSTKDQSSDSELLRLMLEGDEEALTILFRRRQGIIYRFTVQMSGSPSLAEDVTQEVFMVLMRDCATFDEMRGSLKAFLLGIARNLVRQKLSREQFYVSLSDNSEDAAIRGEIQSAGKLFDDVARNETVNSVRKAVLSLPERYREVVVLCDLQEMTYLEAASVLNCAVGTVRSRLHRARVLLWEKLRSVNDESSEPATITSARCFA
jgi:RNA polymerase sigma-70 factor (ECF subfamily)